MKPTETIDIQGSLVSHLKARCTLLWICTSEEERAEAYCVDASAKAGYLTYLWDCARGLTEPGGIDVNSDLRDPRQALDYIRESGERAVYILRDLHRWMDPIIIRSLRSLARELRDAGRSEARTIICLTPSNEIPPELQNSAVFIDLALPDRAEISRILTDDVLGALDPEMRKRCLDGASIESAVDAAVGLTANRIENAFALSLAKNGRIDPAAVAQEKRQIVATESGIEWYDPDPRGLDAVAGLEIVKRWIETRRSALTQRAREFGIPAPKGMLLVGVPGCGKSLTAKCVAASWGVTLLRIDLGALKSKYVGESEGNLRRALKLAESISPCILWVDEIEKALSGSTGPQGDGGVSADALGAILNFMQERSGSVFVIATANDVTGLPPELLRKGRFDEIFFVDLPNRTERRGIIEVTLRQYDREPSALADSMDALVQMTEGWSGAEIAALVSEALFAAFHDGEREIRAADMIEAGESVVPLSQTARERFAALRQWASGRARPASIPDSASPESKRARAIEIG